MARELRRTTRNPLAVATIIDLISGYAAGEAPRTPLQRAVEGGLSKVDPDRSVSRRLTQNFADIPGRTKSPVFGDLEAGALRSASVDDL